MYVHSRYFMMKWIQYVWSTEKLKVQNNKDNFQVYSPGMGHKSRSCFSAQATILQADDHVVLKDIGTARYTLFQHDKSFFGLVKVGELRQQRPPTNQ